jgi:hypothetical protein
MKKYLIAFALLITATNISYADTNGVIDFKGRIKWVGENNVASIKAILSDNFVDVTTTTTTEEPVTTTTAPDVTTTLSPVTTTTLYNDCDDNDDDDDDDDERDDSRDDDCEDDDHYSYGLLDANFFGMEVSIGMTMFDFTCELVLKNKGKSKCKLPGVKVVIKPYKTPGTHKVKVRYTQSILKPADGNIAVVMRSSVFGRATVSNVWSAVNNGYKIRTH